ncbi:hypothetical protein [Streptomyces sp. NBC_01185]|uniref:hypothetical protein n=1 Tax=Streptomyces sp. NBC_01185 TaxID=2903764 RepID=UPI00386CEC5E|nr:hypothetical protein OG770_08210 [Streptomyces sp. NBC_01185]
MSANELLERYIAVWNEPDAAARRATVAGMWGPDGLHYTQTRRFQGTEALVARVTEAYDQFISGQGLRFRSGGAAVEHHGAAAFNWVMTPKDQAGTVLAVGFDVVLLDDRGRIAVDYQFNEPPAASTDLDVEAERYLALTTAGKAHRDKDIAELYLPDARLVDESGAHEGPDAVGAAVAAGGARYLSGHASAQHDALRYPWRGADGEEGVDLLLRDEKGLIREHHRFTGAGRHAA